ncbi:hypothetical protein B0I72DRAFT_139335 [Yarrowia lipolytica]|uniref:Uncharacterized protein n=1 Tax=Yarrowia lipolytica TaxID=4952 RepID=A0A371C3J1_YARLL|nr:hypothetical protein BKA91DRAFT_135073 [Yarrowia lipolytica]KAE8169240.1 hypothetical protein BKA90DRAFT_142999 [Yarrowia lipolytica]RDW24885.1 hypothetical protein B0I71DRAFT_133560 [Yarrowia lipolytica]RDW31709.1 hypothetical protein B0I72DRAFT_139335 [Yarrowia lipolytica]RDW41396.1 hypothetical protein B0I73DRAFT_128751 [Yarrowia lipolytica]
MEMRWILPFFLILTALLKSSVSYGGPPASLSSSAVGSCSGHCQSTELEVRLNYQNHLLKKRVKPFKSDSRQVRSLRSLLVVRPRIPARYNTCSN